MLKDITVYLKHFLIGSVLERAHYKTRTERIFNFQYMFILAPTNRNTAGEIYIYYGCHVIVGCRLLLPIAFPCLISVCFQSLYQ